MLYRQKHNSLRHFTYLPGSRQDCPTATRCVAFYQITEVLFGNNLVWGRKKTWGESQSTPQVCTFGKWSLSPIDFLWEKVYTLGKGVDWDLAKDYIVFFSTTAFLVFLPSKYWSCYPHSSNGILLFFLFLLTNLAGVMHSRGNGFMDKRRGKHQWVTPLSQLVMFVPFCLPYFSSIL